MLKGIKLRLNGTVGPNAGTGGEVLEKFKQAFAAAGHGLLLKDEGLSVDQAGNLSGAVYVSGEQEAPVDFKALAVGAVTDAIQAVRGAQPAAPSASAESTSADAGIEVVKAHEDEDEDVIAPPPLPGAPAPAPPPTEPRQRTKRRLFDEGEAVEPATTTSPKIDALEDCPLGGDGGDHQLNELKNRTHSGDWREVSVEDLLGLAWPEGIERRNRGKWPSEALKEVRANEKEGAIQMTGWLAAVKKEGEESCNCHSPTAVDYHLWLVDDPLKANKEDRWQSVVCETTPRVSSQHDGGWDLKRIREVVTNRVQVRLSGWLMMDQEHPEQLEKTRGTLWEIHPIITFEIMQGDEWVRLEDAEL